MNIVPALPATLAALGVFLVPGLVFLALLSRRDKDALLLDEALYLAVSVSVVVSSWLALVLAELGRFSLVTAGGLLAWAGLAAVVVGRRRLGWPLTPRAASLWPAVTILVLAFLLQARPSEYLVGGRDPGTYVAAMSVIGRTGGIVYTDPLVLSVPAEDLGLFYRHPENTDFSWARFMGFPLERPQNGRVFPEFFHLFPAFGAYLFQAMGVKGALATPPVFGILGTLGVFFALRRVLGPAPAFLASLLLALNVLQVWFSRYPVSEPVSQFLVFLGFLAFWHWEERGSVAFGLLAGCALGLSLLVRIDSALIVLPLGLYLLVRLARRDLPWHRVLPVAVPFALLALHAALHGWFFARKYVLNIAERPYWAQPVWVWIATIVALGAIALACRRYGPRLIEQAETRREALQLAVMTSVVLLALYAYFLRPWLSAWAGGDWNPAELALANPGLLETLGFRRLAAHDAQAFYRMGWFVSPLGLALGLLGLLLAIRDWRPRAQLLLLTALTFSGFYFYKIRIWNDYFFAMRRFVPVILPCLLGFAALLLCRMAARGGLWRAAAAVLTLALGAAFVSDTARIVRYVDWRNSVAFVENVARRFGPEDVVIFEQRASIHLLSLPLWAVHGVNILELARFDPDPEQLQHLIEAWRGRYRNIYFVKTYRTDTCGIFLQRVGDYGFATEEWERTRDRPPRAPEPRVLKFTVSRVVPPAELQVPPLSEVDIGGYDDFQVSGFFDKEGPAAQSFRWTGVCASVYLPGARPGGSLVITASADRRPKPALVRASLSGSPLGDFAVGRPWTDAVLALPDPLPPGAPVLRLDVLDPDTGRPSAWRPQNVIAGSMDDRDLGIMLDRIRIEPGPADHASKSR